MEKKAVVKELWNTLIVLVAAVISALGLHVFVYPSDFAPSGVDGIATMLQSLTKINAGYFTLLFNIPLLLCAWFFLNKRYVIYTVVFTLVSSGLLIVFKEIGLYQFPPQNEKLLAALFSGVLLGVRTGLMLWIGASSGGIDVVAAMVQKKKPYLNIERIISVICYAIMLSSYFVYNDFVCLLLSVVQMAIFEKVVSYVLKGNRNATEVKIVTKNVEEIKREILYTLKHGATVVESRGLYGEEPNTTIYSVINNRQIPEFLKIIKKYPNTFVYYSEVRGVYGNFCWRADDEAK